MNTPGSEGGRDDRGVPYHAESTLSSAQVLKLQRFSIPPRSASPNPLPQTRLFEPYGAMGHAGDTSIAALDHVRRSRRERRRLRRAGRVWRFSFSFITVPGRRLCVVFMRAARWCVSVSVAPVRKKKKKYHVSKGGMGRRRRRHTATTQGFLGEECGAATPVHGLGPLGVHHQPSHPGRGAQVGALGVQLVASHSGPGS